MKKKHVYTCDGMPWNRLRHIVLRLSANNFDLLYTWIDYSSCFTVYIHMV